MLDGVDPHTSGHPRKVVLPTEYTSTSAARSARQPNDHAPSYGHRTHYQPYNIPRLRPVHADDYDEDDEDDDDHGDATASQPDQVPRLWPVRANDYSEDDNNTPPPTMIGNGPHLFSASPGGAGHQLPDDMTLLDQLKQEMDNMRRREAIAMAERQRMRVQLVEAQAEAQHAREAQKEAETMLREEETLRRDEEGLRRTAEEHLRQMQVILSDRPRSPHGNRP